MVITEFDAGDPEATLHALADEILRLLAKAVGWADAGAPFALIARGRPGGGNATAKQAGHW